MQQLLTGTKHYQKGTIIHLPERQDMCGSGGFSQSLELGWLPLMDVGNSPF
jgi:hypothetical protein